MFKIQNSKLESNARLFIIATAVMLILSGCAQMEKKTQICPGKESAAESLSLLKVRSENAVQLKGSGQCLLQYYDDDKRLKKENFPVKLWVNPPVEIYMQGDAAFNPKGVILGSNKEEFWLAVRLKEISGYWWGRWSEKNYPEKLMISPRLVLEALGTTTVRDEESWLLSKDGAFDVLTRLENGVETKKVYINTCDYLVRKIEYLNGGRAAVVMELDRYKEISKNFFVPGVVKIASFAGGNKGDSVQITLDIIKPMVFTDKQREQLFVRPQEQGFKQIYEIIDSKIVEQPK
jgi:hypothetical protein